MIPDYMLPFLPRSRAALERALALNLLSEELTEAVVDFLVTGTAPESKCGYLGPQTPSRYACDIMYWLLYAQNGPYPAEERVAEINRSITKLNKSDEPYSSSST